MGFQMRASRREDGGYDFAYGKSGKKLTAVCMQDSSRTWSITDGFGSGNVTPSKKLGEVKEAWGKRAEASYGGAIPSVTEGEVQTPVAPPPSGPPRVGPPSVGPRVGPPAIRPAPPVIPAPVVPYDGPTCGACGQPITGWHNGLPPCRCGKPNTDNYEPDPFDPKMYGTKSGPNGRELTPIGALDTVFHWMLRNMSYVVTNGKLDPVWQEVQEVLARETQYPEYDVKRFQ